MQVKGAFQMALYQVGQLRSGTAAPWAARLQVRTCGNALYRCFAGLGIIDDAMRSSVPLQIPSEDGRLGEADSCTVTRLWHQVDDLAALCKALLHVNEVIRDSNSFLYQVRRRNAHLRAEDMSKLRASFLGCGPWLCRMLCQRCLGPLLRAPTLHAALQAPMLCELAAFAAAWSTEGVRVAREFAGMAAAWAEEFQQELRTLANNPEQDDNRKRKRLQENCSTASMLAVISLGFASPGSVTGTPAGGSQFSIADAQCLLKHLVWVHYYQGESEQHLAVRPQCLAVASRCARAIDRQLESADVSRQVLSSAARALYETLPDDLEWTRSAKNSGCFIAQSPSDPSAAWYSINIVTGCALRNGQQPARLPDPVTNHPVYKRTMGTLQLDVDDGMATDNPSWGECTASISTAAICALPRRRQWMAERKYLSSSKVRPSPLNACCLLYTSPSPRD